MKVRIRKRFRDIETREIQHVGHVVEYDQERAMELAHGGFVEIVEPSDTPMGETDSTASNGGADDNNTDNSEDGESKDVDSDREKVEASHIPKKEGNKPGKPGRKPNK